ncbi:MAG TPA: hypothetical protein VFQ35_05965 [Polyangiaceae bacterium]|nr:hypothetical protein [Polyangiaceae bacterium]
MREMSPRPPLASEQKRIERAKQRLCAASCAALRLTLEPCALCPACDAGERALLFFARLGGKI